jgi:phospholipid/cholesterol/gamma-HCH transport system substrate-binding protein
LFIGAIYIIGEKQQLFGNTFTIKAIFKDISGLQVGNNVRFSGIVIGTVGNIEIITDTTVRVDMIIDETVRKFIKKDSKAVIGTDGLMGNKILTILAGTSDKEQIQNYDYLPTTVPVNIDDILKQIKTTSENASQITGDMAVIMSTIRSGKGTVGKLFMDTVFADNVDRSLVNIKQGTSGFKQNMDAAQDNILLRGFFKKKKKKQEKEEKEEEEEKKKKEEEQKKKKEEEGKAKNAKEEKSKN